MLQVTKWICASTLIKVWHISKRLSKECVGLLLNGAFGDNRHRCEKYSTPSVPQSARRRSARPLCQESWFREEQNCQLWMRIRSGLTELSPDKSMGPGWLHPRVQKKPTHALERSLSNVFERSQRPGKVPYDGRKENVAPSFKKGQKDNLGKCSLVGVSGLWGTFNG